MSSCRATNANVYVAVCDRLRIQLVPGRNQLHTRAAVFCAAVPRWIEPRDADTSPAGADVFRAEAER